MSKKILIAIILAGCISTLLFLFYPTNSELGKGFVVVTVYMMLRYVILISGIVLIGISLVTPRKLSRSTIYIAFCILNLAVCLSAAVLFIIHEAIRGWLNNGMLNGLVGSIMVLVAILQQRK